ncbi:MAG: isocitrate lyase/phosphoenolpyruvate mutase family protein [Phycisphaeraceae bacterium]|nr:isocitrate lyase/phosphoenolpyruvate mutase family protein [Phycisphaeraceae bacterium]
MTKPHPGTLLRSAMASGVVAAPGAFNALAARAVARAGFNACYVSGAATSVSAGVPDVGLLSLEAFCRTIRDVADGSGLPVIADADTGFGEEEMVRRTVIDYHRAGAAGLHLEDQVFPKRCGHLDGKTLVGVEHCASKIAWAAEAARACSGGAFIVIARTDAAGVEGFDAAVARAKVYRQAGADMIFPEGLHSEDEFARFAEALRPTGALLLANMTEFGKSPLIPLARLGALGYDLVIYPVTLLRIAMKAVADALGVLRDSGSAEGLLERMQTRAELYDLIGYTPGEPWEFRA